MVNKGEPLDATFSALADPTRRGILEQLAKGQTRVTDLAKPYSMSLPAISKHLRVLEKAGLIRRSRVGREHRIRVDPKPIQAARDWIQFYATHWQQQFDALDAFLAEAQRKNKTSVDADSPTHPKKP